MQFNFTIGQHKRKQALHKCVWVEDLDICKINLVPSIQTCSTLFLRCCWCKFLLCNSSYAFFNWHLKHFKHQKALGDTKVIPQLNCFLTALSQMSAHELLYYLWQSKYVLKQLVLFFFFFSSHPSCSVKFYCIKSNDFLSPGSSQLVFSNGCCDLSFSSSMYT